MTSQPDASEQHQPPIDVIEADPETPPRPEEQAADDIRAETTASNPEATPQP